VPLSVALSAGRSEIDNGNQSDLQPTLSKQCTGASVAAHAVGMNTSVSRFSGAAVMGLLR
jgi:hypothetical protein